MECGKNLAEGKKVLAIREITKVKTTNRSIAERMNHWVMTETTSNPGPFDIEAAREKALVKSGHVTPQILDIA